MQTDLSLSVGGLPPMSARGCVQEIRPIMQGHMRRNINGDLVYMGVDSGGGALGAAVKYQSTIYCEDKSALATNGLYIGALVEVGCIQRFWQKVDVCIENSVIMIEKEPVSGSIFAIDEDQKEIDIKSATGKIIKLDNRLNVCFLSYRPKLSMRVINYTLNTNEWGLKTSWKLDLEEI